MLRINTCVAAVAATITAILAAPAAAIAQSSDYVALGDSYTAVGNLLNPVPGSPAECVRDQQSYPQVTAKALGLSLTDMACGDADTANLYTPQLPGVSAQFDGLTPSTKIVSVQIGGNDSQLLIALVASCVASDVADAVNVGAPCQTLFGNFFASEIAADGPAVGTAFRTIHERSPQAKVFVVGYPDVLPQHGNCYPQVPLTTGDVAYANGIELDLNRMLQTEAQANDATYVNTYAPTIGHDACQPESTRDVEPLIPGGPYLFLHPNANGEAQMAGALERAIRTSTATSTARRRTGGRRRTRRPLKGQS